MLAGAVVDVGVDAVEVLVCLLRDGVENIAGEASGDDAEGDAEVVGLGVALDELDVERLVGDGVSTILEELGEEFADLVAADLDLGIELFAGYYFPRGLQV